MRPRVGSGTYDVRRRLAAPSERTVMTHPIGFIGIGNIGGPIATRLVDAGHDVHVVDLDPQRVRALVDRGAQPAARPADVARVARTVFLSLPSPLELREVIEGDGGLLDGLESGTLVVDLSTGDPGVTRELAETLAARSGRWLDSPVTRGVEAARTGTLALLIGGDAADLDGARPLLQAIASDLFHVGDVGSGQVVKLCNNMLVNANLAAAAEVLAAGVKLGVPFATLLEVLPGNSASSFVLDRYLPRLLGGELRTTFALDLAAKDIGLYDRMASGAGASTQLADQVGAVYRQAQEQGLGDRDFVAVAELYEQLTGVELR